MKNYNLAWARKNAGLTQADVATALVVDVDTVGRWERGSREMPRRQWQAFVKLIGADERGVLPYSVATAEPNAAPRRRERKYDARGFPVGFDSERLRTIAIDLTTYTAKDGMLMFDDGFSFDLEETALSQIEGVEWEARSIARMQQGETKPVTEPWAIEDAEACEDAIYFWEQWKLSNCKNHGALKAAKDAYQRWAVVNYKEGSCKEQWDSHLDRRSQKAAA